MSDEAINAHGLPESDRERLEKVQRRAGLRPGKRYDVEGRDYQKAIDDVRFLLGLVERLHPPVAAQCTVCFHEQDHLNWCEKCGHRTAAVSR